MRLSLERARERLALRAQERERGRRSVVERCCMRPGRKRRVFEASVFMMGPIDEYSMQQGKENRQEYEEGIVIPFLCIFHSIQTQFPSVAPLTTVDGIIISMSKLPTLIKLLRKGQLQKLSQLLHSEKPNLNELDPKTGKSLLHLAIEGEDEQAVTLFSKFPGIDLDLPTRDGELPLEMAVRLNEPRMVTRLLELKADPRKRNNNGELVLCLALREQTHPEILKKLLQHIDPNERIPVHGSYLNLSLSAPLSDNFHFLMQQGVKYTSKDDQDNTCLMLAVRANKGDCVVAVLERLANDPVLTPLERQFFFNAQNNDGNTALHEAVLRGYQTITMKLEAAGNNLGWDPSLRNKKGQTIDAIRAGLEKARVSEVELEKRRAEERVVRRKEKQQEKARQREEEQRAQREEKQRRKEEEERAQVQARLKNAAQKKQSIWIGAILLVVILGGMYLMLTNAIEKKKLPSF